jgi:acyl carrier protein
LEEKLTEIFASVFEVEKGDVLAVEYQSVPAWDSIGHMMMIAEVEEQFGISISMEDVIVISNFQECVNVISKYCER